MGAITENERVITCSKLEPKVIWVLVERNDKQVFAKRESEVIIPENCFDPKNPDEIVLKKFKNGKEV